MYASETIQNCKNPTGHIDTLNDAKEGRDLIFTGRLFQIICINVCSRVVGMVQW